MNGFGVLFGVPQITKKREKGSAKSVQKMVEKKRGKIRKKLPLWGRPGGMRRAPGEDYRRGERSNQGQNVNGKETEDRTLVI